MSTSQEKFTSSSKKGRKPVSAAVKKLSTNSTPKANTLPASVSPSFSTKEASRSLTCLSPTVAQTSDKTRNIFSATA